MTDSSPSDHPGLGEATDITAADLDLEGEPATPTTSDPDAMDDSGLGTGDGAELGGPDGSTTEPGGAG